MTNMIKEIEVDGVRHSIQAENTIKVTWAELKALRDDAKLNAGTFYRITDYVTTTSQSETKSANHPFDVIVLALSENSISEEAKAALHEGDTYFADSDLSAWELKYCLDNDKTRFAWADETNGKGVIYRMVDEKRNDCPYDFKNILFYNTKLTSITTNDKYYYTFSYVRGSALYDGTTEKQARLCYGNVMGEYHNSGVLQLNKNVFRNTSFGNSCYSNTFGKSCNRNTFGDTCYSNTFGIDNGINTFGDYCNGNTFGNYCYSNTFGKSCNGNTFGNSCGRNTFGNYCYSNTFGKSCNGNTFGDYCGRNTFGNSLQNHSLNSDKTSITLNEEFYDDGSGQLVPTKHPDLSTQPSILPYKFMGQYVYEQLVKLDRSGEDEFFVRFDKHVRILSADGFVVAALSSEENDGVKEVVNPLKLSHVNYSNDFSGMTIHFGNYAEQDATILYDPTIAFARITYVAKPLMANSYY